MNPILAMVKAQEGKKLGAMNPPFSQWLDGRLISANEGELEIEYEVREEMTNPVGILHGGIHAAIMDDLIGTSCFLLALPHIYLSVNLTVDFLGQAKVGDKVIAKTMLVRKGKTMINFSAEIHHAQTGQLISRATSNMVNSGMPSAWTKEEE
ncbi:PaaI family thioesterase [Bernardetia sp.]|uniref:PaaI family thioesterase n=1 Tax=Bernardetia sp. TaxID=1937974 RepID=UPI0025C68591|nr:PaaI family thioesterase [Bernardetia sp.]